MSASKRRLIRGLINRRNKQFSYGFINIFFSLSLILTINLLYLFKFSQLPALCANLGGQLDPNGLLEHLNFLMTGTTFAVFLAGGLCFLFVLFLTHRFYGPLVPIQRHLEAMKAGQFESRIRIRKKDELHDLCEKLNELTEELQKNYVRK